MELKDSDPVIAGAGSSIEPANFGQPPLDFEEKVLADADDQGISVVNPADEAMPYTRVRESKHLHLGRSHRPGKTAISREDSRAATRLDGPWCPVNPAPTAGRSDPIGRRPTASRIPSWGPPREGPVPRHAAGHRRGTEAR